MSSWQEPPQRRVTASHVHSTKVDPSAEPQSGDQPSSVGAVQPNRSTSTQSAPSAGDQLSAAPTCAPWRDSLPSWPRPASTSTCCPRTFPRAPGSPARSLGPGPGPARRTWPSASLGKDAEREKSSYSPGKTNSDPQRSFSSLCWANIRFLKLLFQSQSEVLL